MRKWLAVFGTLLIVTAGYILPQIIVKTLDEHSEQTYDLSLVNIKYDLNTSNYNDNDSDNEGIKLYDDFIALNMYNKHTSVLIIDNELCETRLTKLQAIEKAEAAQIMLEKFSIINIEEDINKNCECFLATRDLSTEVEDNFSMIVWQISFAINGSYCSIYIDDMTGKMNGFDLKIDLLNSDIKTHLQNLTYFLETYFNDLSFSPFYKDESQPYEIYETIVKAKDGRTCKLKAGIYDDIIYFN